MWEKIKAFLKGKGIEIPEDKENEIKAEIEKLEKDATGNIDFSKLDLSKLTGDKSDPLLKAVVEQNQVLMQQVKDLMTALGEEKKARDNSVKAADEQRKKDNEKKVADAITKALENKKITEADKDAWKGRLEKDFDEWSKELEAKPVPKQFEKKDVPGSGAANAGGEEKKGAFTTLRDVIKEQMDSGTGKV